MRQRTNTKPKQSQPNTLLWVSLIGLSGIVLCGLMVAAIVATPILLGIYGYSQGIGVMTEVPAIQSTSQPDAPLANTGKWLFVSNTSAIDDSKTVIISLDAERAVTGWIGVSVPTLIIRCSDRKLEAYIDTGTVVDVPGNGQVSTRIRFDKNEAEKEIMGPSSDDTALFFKSPQSFLNEAVNHETMAFEFTPYNSTPDDTEFQLTGMYDALTPVLDACNISR